MGQSRSEHYTVARRRRAAGAILALVLLPLGPGSTYQFVSARADARRHPAPGRRVAVDGRRMHLHCTGSGSPTVVFDSALGGTTMDWSLVQPEIARFTQDVRRRT